jgi:MFS superfamily sulfate permease-like transporter
MCCPLALQYKFGARSGAAPVLLGIIKAALALLFGSSLLALLQQFPGPLLGSMLLFSGLELAAAAGKEREPRGVGFMLLTAAAIMGLGDTALGFLVGLGGYAAVAGYERACCHVSLMRARNSDCPAR